MTGYDTKIFAEKFDEFICAVCLNVINEVRQCPNSHLFCYSCILLVLETRKECPVCKVLVDAKGLCHNKYANNSIQKLKTFCISRTDSSPADIGETGSCEWTGTISQRQAHYENGCGYRPVRCSIIGCQEVILKINLAEHLKTCPHRPTECQYCHQVVKFTLMQKHLGVCVLFPVSCPNACGESMVPNEIAQHVSSCPMQPVECPFITLLGECPAKCNGTILRKDFGIHMTAPGRMDLAVNMSQRKLNKQEEQNFGRKITQLESTVAQLQLFINTNSSRPSETTTSKIIVTNKVIVNSIQQTISTVNHQYHSLYVGDLHHEVNESLLFEHFHRFGPVASIRICRDSVTRRSLGYAYVNFHDVQDAERALDTMNFTDIKSKPCRIMWADPSLRKNRDGVVFIRSLAPSVDNKALYDTFSVIGNILSCKVATDDNGASKGYGYVHFETAEAATEAIEKYNGTEFDGMVVQVGAFGKRQQRAVETDWTSLYVKMFPISWDEDKLKVLLAPFGNVANVSITKEDGLSKGFGFVNMENHEGAQKALETLANKRIEDPAGDFEIYVCRARKKNERTSLNRECFQKYRGKVLYVKSIADTVTDDQFREVFAPFGTITSARIMRDTDNKTSKGFGFICYSSAEEANRAVAEMNGKTFQSRSLKVFLYKNHIRAHRAGALNPRFQTLPYMSYTLGSLCYPGAHLVSGRSFPRPMLPPNHGIGLSQQIGNPPWIPIHGPVPMMGGRGTHCGMSFPLGGCVPQGFPVPRMVVPVPPHVGLLPNTRQSLSDTRRTAI